MVKEIAPVLEDLTAPEPWLDDALPRGPEDRELRPSDYKVRNDEERRIRAGNIGAFGTKAEIFNGLLMEDFGFLKSARRSAGEYHGATLTTEDLKPIERLNDLMLLNPHELVTFPAYGTYDMKAVDPNHRLRKYTVSNDFRTRRLATRMARYPPWNVFAHYMLTTPWYQVTMVSVIVLNSLMMAIEGEMNIETMSTPMRQTIDCLDFYFLSMFITEIVMKWIDDFPAYWKESWNIFDFLVSAISMVAPIIDLATQGEGDDDRLARLLEIVKYIRIFRIFRSLNVVTRIRKIMVIWAAITRTFRSLIFITILMAMFYYIFAVIGIQIFDRFTTTHQILRPDQYPDSFKNMPMALISLFQIFTLDKWYDMLYGIGAGQESMGVPSLFVLLWVLIGSFIFRNIFVGVMVNDFQSIRLELMEEQLEILGEPEKKFTTNMDIFGIDYLEHCILTKPLDRLTDFEINIFHNLEIIRATGTALSPFLWPRDTLFHYFLIMEAICHNLDERDKLMRLTNDALIRVYDEN